MLNTCISLLKTISWFRELVHVSNWALAWPISQRGGSYFGAFPKLIWLCSPPPFGGCWGPVFQKHQFENCSQMRCSVPFGEVLINEFLEIYVHQCLHLSLKLNLSGWHWLIESYRFQGYESMIHDLYIALGAPRPKANLPWPPFYSLPPSPPSLWSPLYRLRVFGFLLCSFVAFRLIPHLCVTSHGS